MATIQKKKIKGRTYWYLVESRRINGKPRPVVLKYLGSTKRLMALLQTPVAGPGQVPESALKCYAYGAVAALLQVAREIGLEEIFAQHFPAQQRGGLSVARTLLLATIYRALRPGSKRAFADWVKDTSLPALLAFDPGTLTSQHFWDQMDVVSPSALEAAETEVARRVVEKWQVPLDLLLYDATNFYTWISHTNRRNTLCQYGYNKQKRYDLRQFGLALLCSREELLPLLSKVYAGQLPDTKSLLLVLKAIQTRLKSLRPGHAEQAVTVVMDKGNYSQEIQQALAAAGLHWVAAMSPTMIPGTEQIRKARFRSVLVKGREVRAWHIAKRLWGQEGQLVIYYSEAQRLREQHWLDERLAEMIGFLRSVNGGRRHLDKLQREVAERLKQHDIGQVLSVKLSREADRIQATWEWDKKAYRYLTHELYGREIIFTSRPDWSVEQIIKARYDLGCIENVFRSMKDELHLSVIPEYHWTDQKITVHVFTCLMGLILIGLVHRKIKEKGIAISANRMMDELKEIHEILLTSKPATGAPQVTRRLEETTGIRRQIAEALGLS